MSQADQDIFPVYRERRVPLVLLGFTLLSLFAHAATFFLFQAVYPQHVTLPPSAPQVTLLTGDSPENLALLRWIAAEDPALVAASTGAEPPGLLQLPYRPSYAALRTPPRSLPEVPERPEQPPSNLTLPLALSAAPLPPAAPRRTVVTTTVNLSGGLRERSLASADAPPVRAAGPLQPAQFLIALTDRGEARFAFLQHSSGDEHADALAAAWLARASFTHADAPLTWGFATVRWGDDAFAPGRP